MKKVMGYFYICLLAISAFSFSAKPKEQINWLSMEEMQLAFKKEPRPVLIDLYTSWCGWCKEMDKTTYKNAKVMAYINEHYYAVRFDAESQDDISFNNKIFKYNKEMKANELAMYLSFGQMEYPTTVFLTDPEARPAPLPGYLKPKEMEAPLKYFAEANMKVESFVDFNTKFKNEW
jgi:thioredoxin-related protein